MVTIVTRAGKGSALTHTEMDANLENLNTGKLEASDLTAYETVANAAATYETQAHASSTYATLSSLSTYAPLASPSFSGTISASGDVVLSGSGKTIQGDFSNTTLANRTVFKTTTVNNITNVATVPNGTGTSSSFQSYNTANPTNSSYTAITTTNTESKLVADKTGSGSYLPLVTYVGGVERFRVGTSGQIGFSGTNYGTNGQVLTSTGSTTPPTWSDPSTANTYTGTKGVQILKFGCMNKAASNTSYLAQGMGQTAVATESQTNIVILKGTVVSQLRVFANAAPSGGDIVFTVRKNNADTGITCTITAGTTSASDLSNSISFSNGDFLTIKCVSGALSVGTVDVTATLVLRDGSNSFGVGMQYWGGYSTGTSIYLAECYSNTTTPTHVPLQNCYCGYYPTYIDRPTGSISSSVSPVVAMKGVPSTQAAVPEVILPKFHTLSSSSWVQASDVSALGIYEQLTFFYYPLTSTDYPPCYTFFSRVSHAASTTAYCGGYGYTGSLVESEVQVPMPTCTVRNLCVRASANITTNSTVFTIRKNGVDTGVTCTITAGTQVAGDLVNTVAFNSGDLLSIKCVSGASTGTLNYHVSIQVTE